MTHRGMCVGAVLSALWISYHMLCLEVQGLYIQNTVRLNC